MELTILGMPALAFVVIDLAIALAARIAYEKGIAYHDMVDRAFDEGFDDWMTAAERTQDANGNTTLNIELPEEVSRLHRKADVCWYIFTACFIIVITMATLAIPDLVPHLFGI